MAAEVKTYSPPDAVKTSVNSYLELFGRAGFDTSREGATYRRISNGNTTYVYELSGDTPQLRAGITVDWKGQATQYMLVERTPRLIVHPYEIALVVNVSQDGQLGNIQTIIQSDIVKKSLTTS